MKKQKYWWFVRGQSSDTPVYEENNVLEKLTIIYLILVGL